MYAIRKKSDDLLLFALFETVPSLRVGKQSLLNRHQLAYNPDIAPAR